MVPINMVAKVVAMESLRFCICKNQRILLSFLKYVFSQYRILGWPFLFPFCYYYSLDLRCPLEAQVLKAWLLACGPIGKWQKLLNVGPM
jgi:hypothetical protein